MIFGGFAQGETQIIDFPVIMQRQVAAVQVAPEIVKLPQTLLIDSTEGIPVVQQSLLPTAQTIQKTKEIPQLQCIDKVVVNPVVQVPRVQVVEKTVEIPQLHVAEKTAETQTIHDRTFNDWHCITTDDTILTSVGDSTASCRFFSCFSMGCNSGQPG